VKPVLEDATKEILAQKEEVFRLKGVADKHPFYKYNGLWSRELQNLVSRYDDANFYVAILSANKLTVVD
jgi:hypothetical protein